MSDTEEEYSTQSDYDSAEEEEKKAEELARVKKSKEKLKADNARKLAEFEARKKAKEAPKKVEERPPSPDYDYDYPPPYIIQDLSHLLNVEPSPYGDPVMPHIEPYVPNNDFMEALDEKVRALQHKQYLYDFEKEDPRSLAQIEYDEEEKAVREMMENESPSGSPEWTFGEDGLREVGGFEEALTIGDTDSEEELEDIEEEPKFVSHIKLPKDIRGLREGEEITDDLLQRNQQNIDDTFTALEARYAWETEKSRREQEAKPEKFKDKGLTLQNDRVVVKKEFIKTARGLDLVRAMKEGFMDKEDRLAHAKKVEADIKETALRKKFNRPAPLWTESAQARNLREAQDAKIYEKYGKPDLNPDIAGSQSRDDYNFEFLGESTDEGSGTSEDELEEVVHKTFNPKTKEIGSRIIKEPKSIFVKEPKYGELDEALKGMIGGETAFYKAPPSPEFKIAEADTLNAIRRGLQQPPVRQIIPQRWEGDETTRATYERSRDEHLVGEDEPSVLPFQFPLPKGAGGIIENPNYDKERYERHGKDTYNYQEATKRNPKQTKYKKPAPYVGSQMSHIYKQPVEEVLEPLVSEPQPPLVEEEESDGLITDDEAELSDFGMDDFEEGENDFFSRPDLESRTGMGKGKGKYKGEVHLNFPKLPKSAYEFTTEGKSYGEATKNFLEQQRDAMLKMRQPITNVPITSMFPKDDFGYTIDPTKKGSQVGKAGVSFDPRYVEERKEKEREKALERKAKREEQLEDEYVEDRILFRTKRKEYDKQTTKRREEAKKEKEEDLSKTPRFGIKRPKAKPQEKPPSPPPVAPPRKRRGMKTRPPPARAPSPPPKKSGFRTRPGKKPVAPPSPSPPPSPPPSPQRKDPPLPRGGVRQRGVRSDKGKSHKWSDGRENSATYKANKAKGVDWSAVRCRASTCWEIGDRLEDKKGKGAYKANKDSGEYKKQLRKPKKKEERREEDGWF